MDPQPSSKIQKELSDLHRRWNVGPGEVIVASLESLLRSVDTPEDERAVRSSLSIALMELDLHDQRLLNDLRLAEITPARTWSLALVQVGVAQMLKAKGDVSGAQEWALKSLATTIELPLGDVVLQTESIPLFLSWWTVCPIPLLDAMRVVVGEARRYLGLGQGAIGTREELLRAVDEIRSARRR